MTTKNFNFDYQYLQFSDSKELLEPQESGRIKTSEEEALEFIEKNMDFFKYSEFSKKLDVKECSKEVNLPNGVQIRINAKNGLKNVIVTTSTGETFFGMWTNLDKDTLYSITKDMFAQK